MQKKRTANFREDETKLLIQLWGSPEIQSQLNASHRKAPIMLQIAAAMQHHGFYRTPEEITTRIRNLKCIYHRIKKAQHMGVFGPETADWNHFPAIDAILGDNFPTSLENRGDQYSGNVKKEPNDSETADSMYNGNSVCSDLEDDDDNDSGAVSPMPSPPLQRFSISTTHMLHPNTFLACSALKQQQEQNSGAINYSIHSKRFHEDHHDDSVATKRRLQNSQQDNDVSSLLRQLLDVEKEHLELEKQRLELDRQVGSQLLTLVPLVSNILQKQQQNRASSPAENNASCSTRTNDLVSKLFQTIPKSQTETSKEEPHVSDIYKMENSDP